MRGAKIDSQEKKKLGLGLVVLKVTNWQGFFEDKPWVVVFSVFPLGHL